MNLLPPRNIYEEHSENCTVSTIHKLAMFLWSPKFNPHSGLHDLAEENITSVQQISSRVSGNYSA